MRNFIKWLLKGNRIGLILAKRILKLRPVTSIEELDIALAEADQVSEHSLEAGLKKASKIYYDLNRKKSKESILERKYSRKKVFSKEYFDGQMALYREISGKSDYETSNEFNEFKIDINTKPYPYSSNSTSLVSDYLISLGFLISKLDAPAGSEIIEFGAGWGNLTLQLLQMGFKVTVVEINPDFARYIKNRCSAFAENLTIANKDMLAFVASSKRSFHTAIFNASFPTRHAHIEHRKKIQNIIETKGTIAFLGEPVLRTRDLTTLPYPWGLRIDGGSLNGIRKHGWLELGFTKNYFKKALKKTGWRARFHSSKLAPNANVIIAKKI